MVEPVFVGGKTRLGSWLPSLSFAKECDWAATERTVEGSLLRFVVTAQRSPHNAVASNSSPQYNNFLSPHTPLLYWLYTARYDTRASHVGCKC